MAHLGRAWALAGLGLCLASLAGAEELAGRVQLVGRDGRPVKDGDVRQAVVYFEPAQRQTFRPPVVPAAVTTRRKEFTPRVLVVPRGTRVRFPNEDPILHNVFSVSAGNLFDLGLYKKGPGLERTFDKSGVVQLFCNVHHSMVGYVLVLDTPFYTTLGADGRFRLTGLPRGGGKLSVWHEQADGWSLDVQLPRPGAGELTVPLLLSRPLIPPHLNKLGKTYSSRDRYKP